MPLTGVVTKVPLGNLNGDNVVVPAAKFKEPVIVPPEDCTAPVMRESFPAANVDEVVPCKLVIVTSDGAAAEPEIFPFKVPAAILAIFEFDTAPLEIVKAPVFEIVASPLNATPVATPDAFPTKIWPEVKLFESELTHDKIPEPLFDKTWPLVPCAPGNVKE